MAMALDGTDTNLMTIIHETGHTAFGMRDLYGFGVGSFDISGPTCGAGDAVLRARAPGRSSTGAGSRRTVVDRDGFVNVPRYDSSGQAFLLYDPDQGTDNYFLVENRQRQPARTTAARATTGS